jgi:hypothetical protein
MNSNYGQHGAHDKRKSGPSRLVSSHWLSSAYRSDCASIAKDTGPANTSNAAYMGGFMKEVREAVSR